MKNVGAISLLLIVAGALVVGTQNVGAEDVDVEAGKAKYQMFCSACHGVTGKGDGVAAAALDPKPANHSDKELMGAMTDEYIFEVIKNGGASVGKSPMMAAWGAALSDQDLKNVVAYIRTLAE
ncbi:MAG: c-type cytochrome [Verrucomicrobia bacterium]|nr:c-type cytochrome [Verrucomicrobiota bacterium]